MFKLLYPKFIQDNVYQILSESTGFCGRYDKKHFGVFFSVQCKYGSHMNSRMTSLTAIIGEVCSRQNVQKVGEVSRRRRVHNL